MSSILLFLCIVPIIPAVHFRNELSRFCATQTYNLAKSVVSSYNNFKNWIHKDDNTIFVRKFNLNRNNEILQEYKFINKCEETGNNKTLHLYIKESSEFSDNITNLIEKYGEVLSIEQQKILACVINNTVDDFGTYVSDYTKDITNEWKHFMYYFVVPPHNRITSCTIQDLLDVLKLKLSKAKYHYYDLTIIYDDLEEHSLKLTKDLLLTDLYYVVRHTEGTDAGAGNDYKTI
jgi:hypothetical protein